MLLVAGAVLAAHTVRSRGWPELALDRIAWPAYLAFVVLVVALVPMVFIQHYAAPVGTGSDAHLATGTAEFLKHTYPTGTNVHVPVNQMPPTWTSKYPIYYALASVSSISGLATWQVLAPLAAALLALAAIGMFLVAREVFGAPWAIALAAMALAGLDRMALYTVLNPYFNQTWGFFAMPFTVVLAWWSVQPGLSWASRDGRRSCCWSCSRSCSRSRTRSRCRSRRSRSSCSCGAERRRRIAAGERVLRLGDLYRGRWSLVYLIPLAALLAVPVYGVGQKVVSAVKVLAPGNSLQSWGGDLGHFVPFNFFFSSPNSVLGWVLFAVIVALTVKGFAGQPRALAWGLGGLFVIGIALATYLRHRQFGYYFEFKLLAFVGPMVILVAVLGAGRLRRAGSRCWRSSWSRRPAARSRTEVHGLPAPAGDDPTERVGPVVPAGASIRLDMWPPLQLWAAYFLDSRPLCSQLPLLGTDYPHVQASRKAEYIVATLADGRPKDAIGPALRVNLGYHYTGRTRPYPGPTRAPCGASTGSTPASVTARSSHPRRAAEVPARGRWRPASRSASCPRG